MRFFRGITVPEVKAEQAIATIKDQGLARDRGNSRKMDFRHPGDLDALFAKPTLSLKDTRPNGAEADPGVCAWVKKRGRPIMHVNTIAQAKTPPQLSWSSTLPTMPYPSTDAIFYTQSSS